MKGKKRLKPAPPKQMVWRCQALLRPIVNSTAQDRVRDRILEAYAEYEQRAAADNTQRSPAE